MESLLQFFENNIWLCVIIGIVLIILIDEVLGITRGIFGDDMDDVELPHQSNNQKTPPEDPIEALQREEESADITVDDLLTPTRKRE